MSETSLTFTEKRTKRVVIVHGVPVARVLKDGANGLTMEVAGRVEEIVKAARRAKLPYLETRFAPKVMRAASKASPRKAA